LHDQQREPPFEHWTIATGADRRCVQPRGQCHHSDRAKHCDNTEELGVDDTECQKLDNLYGPNIGRKGTQDRVEWQEVPFGHNVRRRRQRVRWDVVVWVTQIVRHEANHRHEDNKDHSQREQVFDHEVRPEWQCIFCCVFFACAADFNTCRVVVACCVECPDVDDHKASNQEWQQIVQAEEAVQRRLTNSRSTQQPCLQ